MTASISKSELALVKTALDDAEHGRATLVQLAQAHEVAERAGANGTVGLLRGYIRGMTPGPRAGFLSANVVGGIISGVIVWLFLGRHGKVKFT